MTLSKARAETVMNAPHGPGHRERAPGGRRLRQPAPGGRQCDRRRPREEPPHRGARDQEAIGAPGGRCREGPFHPGGRPSAFPRTVIAGNARCPLRAVDEKWSSCTGNGLFRPSGGQNPAMAITPYSGTFGTEELRHLPAARSSGVPTPTSPTSPGNRCSRWRMRCSPSATIPRRRLKNYWLLNGGTPIPRLSTGTCSFGTTGEHATTRPRNPA